MLRPDAPPELVHAGDLTVAPVVSAWLGARQLITRVPVISGSFVRSARTVVPERVDLTVPRHHDGVDWLPRRPAAPLARFGQYLDVALAVADEATGREWTVRLGRCQIQNWDADDAQVSIHGIGLLQRVEDHSIGRPTAPGPSATIASEIRRLITPAGLTVHVDPELADRAVPEGVTFGTDRMEIITGLLEAWPARLRADVTGTVLLLPPLPEAIVPALTLTDGVGGTVVGVPVEDTRDGVHNHVIVRGKDIDQSGNPSFQEEAFVTTGPYNVASYGTVSADPITNDTITSRRTARAVAEAELVKSLVMARILPVEHAPDYRLDIDLPVEVVTHDQGGIDVLEWGYVVGVDIPLTAADGDMRSDVGVYR